MSISLSTLLATLGNGGSTADSGPPATPVASLPPPDSPDAIQDLTVTARKQPPPNLTPVFGQDMSNVDPSTSTAQPTMPPPYIPHRVDPGKYDNTPEVDAINNVRSQYPDMSQNTPGIGHFIPNAMPGAGTLRSMLGTLGDAFLISSGHQPIHRQQDQANQLAEAAAGFDQDPAAAAGRIAATGVPGSLDVADKIQQQNLQHQQIQAQQAYTNQWRDSVMADRTQNHEAAQAIAQAKADDRTRALNGGILAAAARSGDPQAYARARAAAIARVSADPNSKINPAIEYPDNPADFNAAYGLTANQYSRNAQAATNSDIRQNLGQQNVDARNAATAAGVGNNNARVNATTHGQNISDNGRLNNYIQRMNSGGQLTPYEQADYNRLQTPRGRGGGLINSIPGVAPTPAGGHAPTQPQKFINGQRYTDKYGNTKTYNNGNWN